jgi:hypothetical protein
MISQPPDDRLAAVAAALGLAVQRWPGRAGRHFIYPGPIMRFSRHLEAAGIGHSEDVDPDLGFTVSIPGLVVESSHQLGGLGGVLVREGVAGTPVVTAISPVVLVREPAVHDENPSGHFTPEERAQVARRIQEAWEHSLWRDEHLEALEGVGRQLREAVEETSAATPAGAGTLGIAAGGARCWSTASPATPIPAVDMEALKERAIRHHEEPPAQFFKGTLEEFKAELVRRGVTVGARPEPGPGDPPAGMMAPFAASDPAVMWVVDRPDLGGVLIGTPRALRRLERVASETLDARDFGDFWADGAAHGEGEVAGETGAGDDDTGSAAIIKRIA